MNKSRLRWSACRYKRRQKVLQILRRGWAPGLAIGKVLERKRERQQARPVSEGVILVMGINP